MRILLISFYFAPYNNIGSVRVSKMAGYWSRQGHEVRVVSANAQLAPTGLDCPLPADQVCYTDWYNVRRPVEWIAGKSRGDYVAAEAVNGDGRQRFSLLKSLWTGYKSVFYTPDLQIGWYPRACKAALALAKTFKPDVIYASGCPFTALMVAAKVSRKTGIPWIAELRDLWSDSHIYQFPECRRRVDRWLERRTLSSARGIVTVSPALAERLKRRYQIPVEVVTNGFDPEDFSAVPAIRELGQPLQIVYTGRVAVYKGILNPAPIFEALKAGGFTPKDVQFIFHGEPEDGLALRAWAEAAGVANLVDFRGQVSHKESIRAQQNADALLLMVGFADAEKDSYTGKFFEYLGTGRPIFVFGATDNVAAQWVTANQAGVVCSSTAEVLTLLKEWVAKRKSGPLGALSIAAVSEFTRAKQAEKAAKFAAAMCAAPAQV